MIILLSVSIALGLIIGCAIPHFYNILKIKLLEQAKELNKERRKCKGKFSLLIVISLMPFLLFHKENEIEYLFFFLVFGLLAYSDYISRWLPDPLVYLLVGLAVFCIDKKDLISPLLSVILYVLPLVVLNVIGWLGFKKTIIAAGDFYVLLSVGILIFPYYSMVLVLITILLSMIYSKFTSEVPFIFVAYIVMLGYELCVNYGMLSL